MKAIKCFFYIILFIYSISCFSQEVAEKVLLTEVISKIETKFNVKISYAYEDVSNILIEEPVSYNTLEEVVNYLNVRTLLNFKILNDRYITVSVIEKTITICGVILSKQDNLPLFGASVLLNNTTRGTITNGVGEFQFKDVPLKGVLTLSYLGFITQQIRAVDFFSEDSSCKTIYFEETEQELNQVLITKYLTTGLQKLIDGSTVLNTEKFGILPGLTEPDILQSIQALPGVESINESIANINVRGGTNDQNLIFWDNIKMYHSGHFFGLISAYNPYLTNKVIVTKNGTSSQYSDGVSSTINMFTKNKVPDSFHGGGGLNLISGDVFLEIPISNKIGLQISGRRSITDAFNTPTYDNYFKRSFEDSDINTNEDIENSESASNFLFYDYSAKLLIDINENQQFRFNAIGINNNLDYSESITNNENETKTKRSNLIQENLGFGGSWDAKWNSKFRTNILGYYSKYNVDASDERIETEQLLTQANEVLETGLKLNTYYKITPNLNLLNGYQLNETGILNETTVTNPSYERTKKDVLLNHSLFSEAEYNKGTTYLRVGMRANYFEKFNKLLIEPRLNFRQKFSNILALKIEGEFKNQSATQIVDFQDDFLGVENRRWILANEESIPISVSKQASLGFELNQNNLNIDMTGFYKKVDGITASNQGFYNNFQYLNASGNYIAKGIEFLANKTTEKYSTWLSYCYSINNYEFSSFTPSSFPNNVDIRHSVSLAFNYKVLENLEFSVGGLWRSGQPYTKPMEGNETIQDGNSFFVNYDLPNGENVEDFMRLDMSISYTFNLSKSVKSSLNLGVKNVTNESNVINRYFEVDPNNSSSTLQIDNNSLSRTPNLSMRVNF